MCCHGNETRAPITNLPNSAQLEGTAYHFRKLHPRPCSSACGRGQTVTNTFRVIDSREI